MIRLGIVDCDTSHCGAFTQRLHHVDVPEDQWVDGAQVVAAVPGTSLVSPERIPGFVDQLRGYGVEILERPEELLGRVDGVLIEAVDGSVHLERALPFIEAGVPLWVDKPFTTSKADAIRLLDAAEAKSVPVFSSSALRYAGEVTEVRTRREELGAVLGADTYGPGFEEPRNPGLFNYGVHAVEMLYQLLGTGCRTVRNIRQDRVETVVGVWDDGRIGTVRGTREGPYAFGFTAFCEQQVVARAIHGSNFYGDLVRTIVGMFESGRQPLSRRDLLEPVAFQEAANRSAAEGGAEVTIGVD